MPIPARLCRCSPAGLNAQKLGFSPKTSITNSFPAANATLFDASAPVAPNTTNVSLVSGGCSSQWEIWGRGGRISGISAPRERDGPAQSQICAGSGSQRGSAAPNPRFSPQIYSSSAVFPRFWVSQWQQPWKFPFPCVLRWLKRLFLGV